VVVRAGDGDEPVSELVCLARPAEADLRVGRGIEPVAKAREKRDRLRKLVVGDAEPRTRPPTACLQRPANRRLTAPSHRLLRRTSDFVLAPATVDTLPPSPFARLRLPY